MQHRKGQEYNSPSYCWYVQATYTSASCNQTAFIIFIGDEKMSGYLTLDFCAVKYPLTADDKQKEGVNIALN